MSTRKYCEYYDGGLRGDTYVQPTIKVEGTLVDGVKEGLFKRYGSDGRLWSTCHYKNDKKHGEKKIYHENGNIEMILLYTNGVLGIVREYFEDGSLRSVYLSDSKKQVSVKVFVEYHENGVLKKELVKDDEEGQEYEEYDFEGTRTLTSRYRDGKRNGHWVSYYKNGRVKGESTWKDDGLEGESIEYYPNGKKHYVDTYENRKVVKMIKYRRNGELEQLHYPEKGTTKVFNQGGGVSHEIVPSKNGSQLFRVCKNGELDFYHVVHRTFSPDGTQNESFFDRNWNLINDKTPD